jgi:hypothetical protein
MSNVMLNLPHVLAATTRLGMLCRLAPRAERWLPAPRAWRSCNRSRLNGTETT